MVQYGYALRKPAVAWFIKSHLTSLNEPKGFPMLARLYLRASTDEQDASRTRASLEAFAAERGLLIAGAYVENESGAKLARPELFRLLADSKPGDVLLIEQVDRLSRLTSADWTRLRADLDARQVRVVVLDLPTSWMLAAPADDFTGRMFAAVCRATAKLAGQRHVGWPVRSAGGRASPPSG